jgi:phospholipid/cholesterol/gamma-HCH transport system substrate-binding protein
VKDGIRGASIKLAIFTLVTILVTTWLASIIGNFKLFAQPYKLSAEFSDATGLLKGDVVKAAGVTVGRVEDIGIDDGIAVVSMSIDEDVKLPASITASIRFRNLVGQRMVTLVEDSSVGLTGLLQPGERIPLERTQPAFDLSVLFNGLRPLIRSTSPRDINLVSRAVVEALEGREDEVEDILTNVADISDMIVSRDNELSDLLSNVNLVASDLNERDEQLKSTLGNLEDFLSETSDMKADLEAALLSLDNAATRLGRVIRDNEDDIKAEVKDLRILLDAVNDKRVDLREALRSLPEMLVAVERVNSYGQWANIHLIHACKDDLGTCGTRGTP